MTRRLRGTLMVAPTAAALAAALVLVAGQPVADAVAAACCVSLACAGVLLAGGETVRWPSPAGTERTSAGWHDVRLLAELVSRAGTDPTARRQVTARINAAVPADPAGRDPAAEPDRHAPVSRRQYEAALAQLRRTARP